MTLLRDRIYRRGVHFLALALLIFTLGACDDGGPGPSPNGPLPTVTVVSIVPSPPVRAVPAVTPISPVESQTLEGVKVSVQPLSFDAHRVIVAYSLEGPAQPHRYWIRVNSYDDEPGNTPVLSLGGKVLPWIEGEDANSVTYVSGFPPAGDPLRVQGTIAFDASAVEAVEGAEAARELPAQLTLPLRVGYEFYSVPEPVPTGTILPTVTPTQAHPASRMMLFALSFPIAFDPTRVVVQVGQSVEHDNISMTLKSVDITASETRMTLRYPATKTAAYPAQWDEIAGALRVGSGDGNEVWLFGKPGGSNEGACNWDAGNGECVFSYSGPSLLGKAPVECTLTITAGLSGAFTFYQPPQGTWVFHFTAPAAPIKQ